MRRGGRMGKLGRLAKAAFGVAGGAWRGISSTQCGYPPKAMAEELEGRRLLAVSPLGSEFQVNTYTTSWQFYQSAAMDAQGNYVLVWLSDQQGGIQYGVYGRRYTAAGAPVGTEFQVNAFTTGGADAPAVAMDADGDFVVVWGTDALDGAGSAVVARRFNSNGVPLGTEFVVNTYTTGFQSDARIAMEASGEFIIAWQSFGRDGSEGGLYAQRFDATGAFVGSEFQVNAYTPGDQSQHKVAINDSGDAIIAWESAGQDGSQRGIYARRFNASGGALATEFRVNSYTTGDQRLPSVGIDSRGDSVVVWQSYGQDGSLSGVYAQRFGPTGVASGSEFRVNAYTTGYQWWSSVAMRPDGDFLVSWASQNQLGSGRDGVYMRRYNAAGESIASEYRVNSTTTNQRYHTSVGMNARGDILVSWVGSNQDGSLDGIYGRFYAAVSASAGTTVGDFVWNDLDGDGIQDAGEPGLGGISVDVIANGPFGAFPADTSVTDSVGTYHIVFPLSMSAYLHFGAPPDWGGTRQDQGPNDNLDSDIDISTRNTSLRSYTTAGATDNGVDAGLGSFGAVTAFIYNDRDRNGVWAPNEELLSRSTVFLDEDGDGILDPGELSTLPNSLGFVTFSFVAPGTKWLAVVDEAGWIEPLTEIVVSPGLVIGPFDLPMMTDIPDTMAMPIGDQFRINTYTTGTQFAGGGAYDSAGNFVVVWSSNGQDGSSYGIYAQRFGAVGAPIGSEFRVNSYTTGSQKNPVVAMTDSGSFTVVWESVGQDGSGSGIYARRYDAAGMTEGTEFRVNSYTSAAQATPRVASASDGDLVIVWTSGSQDGDSYGIYAQRYDSAGVVQGPEFRVNAFTTSYQGDPSVAMDDDGHFVIAWNSTDQDGNPWGIYARRYESDGTPLGTEFRVNQSTLSIQNSPGVAMTDEGAFVVVWQGAGVSSFDIFAASFSSDGVRQGADFLANTYTTGDQTNPVIVYDTAAGFMIAWRGPGIGDIDGLFSQRFNSAGLSQGSEWRVNTATTNSQAVRALTMSDAGDILVLWTNGGSGAAGSDVFARQYAMAAVPEIVSHDFVYQEPSQRVKIAFSEGVAPFVSSSALSLQKLTSPTQNISNIVVSYDSNSDTATFTFPTLPNGGTLPDGRYRATFIPPNAPAAANQSFDFFFINGDANHDGIVNLYDLVALAPNFGATSGVDYTMGDFDYNGVVNSADLGILAVNWQKSLATLGPALPSAPTSAPAPRAISRTPTRTTSSVIELVAEAAPTPDPAPVRSAIRAPVR